MSDNSAIAADVLVIGAGPVGLTLANELRRREVNVRIVDKGPAIREISKALIWHVRTQEALDKIGVMAAGTAEAKPLREVAVHAYGKPIGSWVFKDLDSPHPFPLIIGQNRTQHLLLDHLAAQGAQVEWNTEAVTLAQEETGVSVTLRHTDPETKAATDEEIRVGYIVGCEGSNSLVRKALNLTFEGEHYSGEQFIQADCKIKWTLPGGRSYLFLTEDGYMMVIEMPDDLVRIFISLPDDPAKAGQTAAGQQEASHNLGAAEDMSNEPTLDEIRENFERLTGIAVELYDPVWRARYRTSHRYANKFSEGRAFIAGDAGHVHVPIGGQGMNTGIQDAFNLGWKLAGVVKGIYKPEILETYNAERHPVAEGLIKGTDRAYKGILHPGEFQQRAARLFGPFLVRQEPVQRLVRNILEELTIAYPETPLNHDGGGASGPKPGERVLDAPVVRWSDKKTVTLNELTRFAGWTALLFGGTPEADYGAFLSLATPLEAQYGASVQIFLVVPAAVPPANLASSDGERILLDAERYLHEKYGVSHPTIYLLRPDTFVGFRGTLRDSDALLKYLKNVFA